MKNIWQELKKPILALAPMEDVTDSVFRQMVALCSKPDLYFTEFANCDGLQSVGRKYVINRLKFSANEQPIIAQIWGRQSENFYKTAQEIKEMGFAGIDLNMGCPEKSVTSHGGGGALIKDHHLAQELILATREGAGGLPVSVKTRIGYKEIQTEEWIGWLLSLDLDGLTIHGRTVAQQFDLPANWEEIGKAVKLRNQMGKKAVILGNGDVKTHQGAFEKVKRYGVDGVMVGRGIFNNLWIFDQSGQTHNFTIEERTAMLLKHTRLFVNTWGNNKNFAILKKFFKIYISDFEGASDLRAKLMATNSLEEVEKVLASSLLVASWVSPCEAKWKS